MNSGGSNDLNRIKIDPRPRTGEKFSFNMDIVFYSSGHGVAWPGSEPILKMIQWPVEWILAILTI